MTDENECDRSFGDYDVVKCCCGGDWVITDDDEYWVCYGGDKDCIWATSLDGDPARMRKMVTYVRRPTNKII